ncbi:MAG: hypothetical protein NC131_19325 [Roseburia sp.]|nr:hypothetical protein [Roseburia sp.]
MKKVNAFGYILCVSAALALVGMVVYIVNTTTGYLAGNAALNIAVILLPIVVAACAVFLFLKPDAFSDTITGIVTFALAVLMAVATVLFVTERVDVIGDMLNPVNHPDTQATAVTWAIVGIVLYLVSFLGAAVTTLSDRLAKQ